MSPESRSKFMQDNATSISEGGFSVGDKAVVTNDYGVQFGVTVLGFCKPEDRLNGRSVYLDWDCYWFPTRTTSLRHI